MAEDQPAEQRVPCITVQFLGSGDCVILYILFILYGQRRATWMEARAHLVLNLGDETIM